MAQASVALLEVSIAHNGIIRRVAVRDSIDRGVKVGIGCDLVLKDQERFFGVLPDTTFEELSDVHKCLLHACLTVSHACVSCSSKIPQSMPVDINTAVRCHLEIWYHLSGIRTFEMHSITHGGAFYGERRL